MSYQVVLPMFEGPLDLLLHLIEAHELDVYNIPIAFITGQYMDYLKRAETIDLNLSGEFLVMAGTLLAIKAKMLLPQRTPDIVDGETADPRDELVEKLLEYRMFKENALELKKLEESRTKIYFREVNEKQLLARFPQPNPVSHLKAEDLHAAFQEILRLLAARGRIITVYKDAVSVKEKVSVLTETLSGRRPGGMRFTELLLSCDDMLEAITTFLALLELLTKGRIWVRQTGLFSEIWIGWNDRTHKERTQKEEPAFALVPAGD